MESNRTLKAIRLKREQKTAERRATEAEQQRIKELEKTNKRLIRQSEDELHIQEVPGIVSVFFDEARSFKDAIMRAPEAVQVDTGEELTILNELTLLQRIAPGLFRPTSTIKAGWNLGFLLESDEIVTAYLASDGTVYIMTKSSPGSWYPVVLAEATRSVLESLGWNTVSEMLKEMRIQRERFDAKVITAHQKA